MLLPRLWVACLIVVFGIYALTDGAHLRSSIPMLVVPACHVQKQGMDAVDGERVNTPPMVICIDPGHSKKTVGATGKRLHLQEYKLCWQMAKKLEAVLKARGAAVILTKSSQDANIGNDTRARIANQAQADLLLRLHCDSGKENGIATFYPARQGTIRGVKGPDETIIKQSGTCAHAFHAALLKSLDGALHNRGVRTDAQTAVGGKLGGALEGSIYATVPVVLVEMCVLDNHHDEAFIGSPSGQKRLAQALADGAQAAIADNRAANQLP